MSCQRVEKWPVSNIRTRSPGESVLTRAASHAPVPEAGKMTTDPCVLKTARRFERTSLPSCPNSGPR